MEEKKPKVDYAAIIREYTTYHRGESLKHFCEEGGYNYSNVLRYQRKSFWNHKQKTNTGSEPSFVPVEVTEDPICGNVVEGAAEQPQPVAVTSTPNKVEKLSILLTGGLQITFENGGMTEILDVLRKIAG